MQTKCLQFSGDAFQVKQNKVPTILGRRLPSHANKVPTILGRLPSHSIFRTMKGGKTGRVQEESELRT